jgi:hypothetical protein
MGVIDKGLLRHVLTSPEAIPDLATQRARHMNSTELPVRECCLSTLRIKMGVGKKVLYMDVTHSSTAAQAYRFVEDKEGQRDFKLMYKNSCLEKDDTQLVYLIDDFTSDVMVQPVDGLLGGMEKGTAEETERFGCISNSYSDMDDDKFEAFQEELAAFCVSRGETVRVDDGQYFVPVHSIKAFFQKQRATWCRGCCA